MGNCNTKREQIDRSISKSEPIQIYNRPSIVKRRNSDEAMIGGLIGMSALPSNPMLGFAVGSGFAGGF